MVPGAGLEPARDCSRGILSPLRLPIPPPGLCEVKVYQKTLKVPLNGGATRIRTGDQGFAGPCLSHLAMAPCKLKALSLMERATGFEPATSTLARWRSSQLS